MAEKNKNFEVGTIYLNNNQVLVNTEDINQFNKMREQII